ncbi:hypothetical protein CPB85DRAFT_1436045 [Mucidula mucida]|nr:hypothetical protein CPB85DRAFT_1436045 [Mucidula mucida]
MPLITVGEATDKSFDYVVVGGGTAGLVVAARLSENPDVSVLVLDAGKPNLDDVLITRPGQYGPHSPNLTTTGISRLFPSFTQAAENFRGIGEKPGWKLSLELLLLDYWERLGNPKWNWDTYEKYIQRVATFYPNEDFSSKMSADALKVWDKKWGQGPLKLSHPKNILDVSIKLQETFVALGLPWAQAPNGGNPAGTYLVANTLDPETNGRSYATSAFFTPNAERKNLNVLAGALVHKLNTETGKTGLKATSVDFSYGSDGVVYSVQVKKEVILCAGALKSPQILELSGIGRPDVLNKINVPVKIALEGVGENVQDHNFMGLTYALFDTVTKSHERRLPTRTYDALLTPDQFAHQVELYKKNEGVFMMGISEMAYAGLATMSPRAEDLIARQRQKIESDNTPTLQAATTSTKSCFAECLTVVPDSNSLGSPALCPSLLQPRHDPRQDRQSHEHPDYDPHYFEHEFDRQVLVDMVRFVRKVARTAPVSDFFDPEPVELNPGPQVNTDAEIADWVTKYIGTTFHVCGSLSMLPRDKRGVVDAQLKVYGTENIRVADLSIVPLHFAAHPVASVYTIGEMASAIIRGEL